MSLNLELARHNMVEQQVRPWDVLDQRVLDTLKVIRRENFVPHPYRNLAFADLSLPLGHRETMMKPTIEGRLLQALAVNVTDNILEIGTGSGFLTACLAYLGQSVISLEQHADFVTTAKDRLAAAGMSNVKLETIDAVYEYQPQQSFDAIAVTGGAYALPQRFREWLNPGGRLFAIVGESPAMRATLYTRISNTEWKEEILFETDLPYLNHCAPPKHFVL